jgi:hypothetical protein
MAASGGCPELFELEVAGIDKNVDCLPYKPSLIESNLQILDIIARRRTEEEALLLYCGLVEIGYRNRLRESFLHKCYQGLSAEAYACMRAISPCGWLHETGNLAVGRQFCRSLRDQSEWWTARSMANSKAGYDVAKQLASRNSPKAASLRPQTRKNLIKPAGL